MSSTINPNAQLGQNAFLQLMMTQMKYQDPLQPQDNSQFLAQLAQFTSLEQMTNVAQTDGSILTTLTGLEGATQLNFAYQLMGQQVTVTDSNGSAVKGSVTGISISNGEPQFVVNGQQFPLSSLTGIGDSANGSQSG